MIKIIIAEDEKKAADKLVRIVKQIKPEIDILAVFETIVDTVSWFSKNPHPDLLFLDIQLADGLSFEIFKRVEILAPVIFITAFDQYAIQAFKVNSIDYVLKPFQLKNIEHAINKYKQLKVGYGTPDMKKYFDSIQQISNQLAPNFKSRFFVNLNNRAYSIPVDEISFFIYEDKSVLLVNLSGQRFVVNFTLDKLETLIDPNLFFRINRQFLIHIKSIGEIKNFERGRISLFLKECTNNPVLVSRSRTQQLKAWLDK
jgi:DNA-binding LytR/AlgR family response regulator